GVYWKNGVIDTLPGSMQIDKVLFVGSNLYFLGELLSGGSGWWENGTANTIPVHGAYAKDIAVSGSGVYILSGTNANGLSGAMFYWKDGKEVDLPKSSFGDGLATGIALSDTSIYADPDVYVCGMLSGILSDTAVYWKNNQLIYLPDGEEADHIAVSGMDVYVVGRSQSSPRQEVYWKNGVEVKLGTQFIATSITVSGNDLYLAGFLGSQTHQACYMKNGLLVNLPGGNAASGIAVNGTDVYACGNTYDTHALLWKNGVVDTLGAGYASGIVIAP
ncbi:MAG TPA: hypothetical protein VGS79_12750, partial [Puia sp.]|nr:hypothetical protein [Puia sp.]